MMIKPTKENGVSIDITIFMVYNLIKINCNLTEEKCNLIVIMKKFITMVKIL